MPFTWPGWWRKHGVTTWATLVEVGVPEPVGDPDLGGINQNLAVDVEDPDAQPAATSKPDPEPDEEEVAGAVGVDVYNAGGGNFEIVVFDAMGKRMESKTMGRGDLVAP